MSELTTYNPFAHLDTLEGVEAMLKHLGLESPVGAPGRVNSAFKRFNNLARNGYDLSQAPATAEIEAMRSLSRIRPFFRLTEILCENNERFIYRSPDPYKGDARVGGCNVTIRAKVDGTLLEHGDEGRRPEIAALRTYRKLAKEGYDIDTLPVRFLSGTLEPVGNIMQFEETGDTSGLQASWRVTLQCVSHAINGEELVFRVQDVRPDTGEAIVRAMGKGLEYAMRKSGFTPMGG